MELGGEFTQSVYGATGTKSKYAASIDENGDEVDGDGLLTGSQEPKNPEKSSIENPDTKMAIFQKNTGQSTSVSTQ